MPRINKQNIDQKTNIPNAVRTEGLTADTILNRSEQTRRDDDVIRTPKRTLHDIDYAIKWYIENEISPQIKESNTLLNVPIIFANGEKWDNVQKLGYLKDEKGVTQAPLIMLKRNSVAERDTQLTLDVNRNPNNYIVCKSKYNQRNNYEDELFPNPLVKPTTSDTIYLINIPKYITVEYDIMIWCNFTTQLNDIIEQIMPYGRFSWGTGNNMCQTTIGAVNFETTNTVGEDRLVRATIPITVLGQLLSEQEAKISTLKKIYSIKKVSFDTNIE